MLKKLFLPSLVLVPLLFLHPYGQVQAETPLPETTSVQPEPEDTADHSRFSSTVERLKFRDQGSALTMSVPLINGPFYVYRLEGGLTLFVNDKFLNGDVPLRLTALLTHMPAPAGKAQTTAEPFKDDADRTILSYQTSPLMRNVKILSNEALKQKGSPARRLTMSVFTHERDTIVEILWIGDSSGAWLVQFDCNADDTNTVDLLPRLLSSVSVGEDTEK